MWKGSGKAGTVTGQMISFAIPLILSAVLQQLYNWADALILGNVEGELALGAIGGTGNISNFFLLMITGFTIGIGVLAAQKFGGGELTYVRRVLKNFAALLGGVSLVLASVGYIASGALLRLIDTPEDTIVMAESYLRIILMGIPFLAVYNVYSAVIRGVGDSRAPFFSVLVSSAINIVLDLILVVVLRCGITGAATATVISQAMMTVFIILYTHKRHPQLRQEKGTPLFSGDVIRSGLKLGIPPMLQSCITAVGNMILQSFMNGFGTATVIAITTAYRIDTLAMLPLVNTGSAISTLTAQSYGAGDTGRMHQVRRAGIRLMIITSVILTLLVIPFGSRLIALFGAGPEAVQIGHDFFVRLAIFYVVFGLSCALRGCLEGIGDVGITSILGLTMLAVRIVCSYALAGLWGNMVIAYAEGIAWIIGCTLYAVRVRQKMKFDPKQTVS